MDYNIFSVFASASLVAQLIMVILIALSILSWTVIISKIITLSAAERKATAGILRFTDAPDLRQAVQSLGGDPSSPLYGVAQHGVREFNNGKEVGADESVVVETVRRALNQGVGLEIDRLHKHLSILATAAYPFLRRDNASEKALRQSVSILERATGAREISATDGGKTVKALLRFEKDRSQSPLVVVLPDLESCSVDFDPLYEN